MFGAKPAGLWPSEGSVSDQALTIAAEEGFQWFGTDEGVLGRTLNVGFFRDAKGIPANAERLYKPLRVQLGGAPITGLFRDHHLSDLIGFVYSRMNGKDAAADLHGRLREIGERVQTPQPLTVCLFLDGENAWEYYPGNGREFLREFYGRIQGDQDFRALTASEAIAAAGDIPANAGIFPASWINANFDVWIGHSEDVAAWELLWDAREAYGRALEAQRQGRDGAPGQEALKEAHESLLAAEGSDWCWWFGPEHSTANDAEFDALYRKHLTAVYLALGQVAPRNWQSQSSGNRSMPCSSPLRAFSRFPSMGEIPPTSNGWAPDFILPRGAAARCTAALSIFMNYVMVSRMDDSASESIPFGIF